MRSLLLVATLIAVAAAAFPAGADAAGGWTAIANPRSLVMRQIGNFAVIVYSNADPHRVRPLALVNVVRGETQPAAAAGSGVTDYRLVLNVRNTDTGSTALYQAVVRGKPGTRATIWELRTFLPYK